MSRKKKTLIVTITAVTCTVLLALLAWLAVIVLQTGQFGVTTETEVGTDHRIYATKVIEISEYDAAGQLISQQLINRDPTTSERALFNSATPKE